MAFQDDLDREKELKEFEKSRPPYKFTIRVGERIINNQDPVTVVRSSGEIEKDWVFVAFNPKVDRVTVRKYKIERGEKTLDLEKGPSLAQFSDWQSK